MAKFNIYSAAGVKKGEGYLTFTGTYMKPGVLDFRELASPTPISWAIGDYVGYVSNNTVVPAYPRTGFKYTLYTIPQLKKNAGSGKHGQAYVYQNVQFYDASYLLSLIPFRDLVKGDNRVHFSTQPSISVFDNVAGIAERIQACLDLDHPGEWNIQVATIPNDAPQDAQDIKALMEEDRDFSVSGVSLLDVCNKVYEVWPEVGWVYSVVNNVNTITFGGVILGESSALSYKYGKGYGLKSITRAVANGDEMANRIFAYGSSRNMMSDWYRNQTIKDAASVDIEHLMLPIEAVGTQGQPGYYPGWRLTDNLPDASKAFVEDAASIARLGIREKAVYFDGTQDLEEIYPTIRGMKISDVRNAMQSTDQYYPSTTIYTDDTVRIDKVLSVESTFDSGLAANSGKDNLGTSYESLSVNSSGTLEASTSRLSVELFIRTFTAPESGNLDIKGAIDWAGSLSFGSASISGEAKLSLTVAVLGANTASSTIVLAKEGNAFLFDGLSALKTAITVSAGDTVIIACAVSLNAEPVATDRAYTITANGELSMTFSRHRERTFNIKLRQLGFDISQQAALGNGKSIHFRTGKCAGRTFSIKGCTYQSATDTWLLEVIRSNDESLSQWFPNSTYDVVAGDEFVLLDIAMPDSYVVAAEKRLLAAAQDYLAWTSKEVWQYTPDIDAKFMVDNTRVILPATYINLTDSDVVDGDSVQLVDSVTINEGEAEIPTYKVTLRERKRKQASSSAEVTGVTAKPVESESTSKNVNSRVSSSFFEEDGNGGVKLKDEYIGLWAAGYVSAGGVGSGGSGGGGIDLDRVWQSLTNSVVDSHATDLIALAHIPDLSYTKITGLGAAATYGVGSVAQNDGGLVTGGAVWSAIDALPEPMIFKGSLGTGGTITSLPTASSSNEGWTYKVITDGTYASQAAKVGDLFISNGSSWIWIPSGDEPSGTVTSVGLSVPTGLAVTGSPITTSGTLAITFATGYSIPLTADTNKGVTAYGWGNHADAGYFAASSFTAANIVSTLGTTAVNRATADASGNTITSTYQTIISDLSTIRTRSDEGHTVYGYFTNGVIGSANLPAMYIGTTQVQFSSAAQALSGITTIAASGLATIAGGVKLTTTKKIWFGDTYYIELDSNGIHTNAGFYSDSFVSAGGVGSGGGGGTGVDLDRVWQSLSNTVVDSHANDLIAVAHIPNIENITNFSTKVYDASVSRTANYVLAAPNGSNGAASFRALVEADIPTLSTTKIGAAMWKSLQNNDNVTTYNAYKIATDHLPSLSAGTGLSASYSTSGSGTAIATTLSIAVASGYKLPTTTEWGNKADASVLASDEAIIDIALRSLQAQIDSVAARNNFDELTATEFFSDVVSASNVYAGAIELAGSDLATTLSNQSGRISTLEGYFSNSVLPVSHGGTGLNTLTSGYALIGNGTSAVSLRAITNNTSATAVSASTNLVTANTLYYHTGNSNITTVGTISSGTWQGSTIANAYLTGQGKITIGSSEVALGGTMTNLAGIGTITASGLIKTTNYVQAARFYLTDSIYFVADSNGVKLEGAGFYTDSFVSAGGVGSGGSGGGIDLDRMWQSLTNSVVDSHANDKIAVAHIPTSVTVGSTNYTADASTGVIAIPAYPTTLPASDVYSWAKASTKPSYAFSEITGTATASQVPSVDNLTNFSTKVYDASVSRTANYVLAAPNGSAGAATFRALVAADIPSLTISKISDAESWISGKGYVTSSGVTSVATGTGLTGGTITSTGTISINSTYQTYISNGNTAYGWGNHANAGYLTSANGTTISSCLQSLQAQIDSVAANRAFDEIVSTAVFADMLSASSAYIGTITGSLTGNATTASYLYSSSYAKGGEKNPVYFSGGLPVASTSTEGSASLPVYLNGGTLTAITASSMFPQMSSSTTTNLSVSVAGQNRTIPELYAKYDTSGETITDKFTIVSNALQSLQGQIDSVAAKYAFDTLTATNGFFDMLSVGAGIGGHLRVMGDIRTDGNIYLNAGKELDLDGGLDVIYYDSSNYTVFFNFDYNSHFGSGIYSDSFITAGASASSSDARLKDDIHTVSAERAISLIMALRGCEWTWNDKKEFLSGKHGSGLIAQEVDGVMPWMVLDLNGEYSLTYNSLWGVAIPALQSHESRIQSLENEVSMLRAENEELNRRLTIKQ